MGDHVISFLPVDEVGTSTVNLTSLFGGLTRFAGGPVAERRRTRTKGGKVVTVTHDTIWRYSVQARGMIFPAASALGAAARNLWSWNSSAIRGGEFAFQFDNAKTYDTLLDGAITRGTTSWTVDDTTGMATDDWLFIEDVDDPNKWEKCLIVTVPTSTTLTVQGLTQAFGDNSVVRYHEYFPACSLVGDEPPLVEREAPNPDLRWDLDFEFELVR